MGRKLNPVVKGARLIKRKSASVLRRGVKRAERVIRKRTYRATLWAGKKMMGIEARGKRGNMRNDNMLGTVVVILVAIGLAIWWIEDRFGTSVTGYALMSAGGVIIVVIGIVLAMATMRFTMSSMTTFAQRDAQTDKYRMQAFREMSRGESAERAAAAKITVLDAKRIEDLSRERAKLLTDAEVARLQAEHERLIATQRKSSGLWDDEGDEDDEEGFTQW